MVNACSSSSSSSEMEMMVAQEVQHEVKPIVQHLIRRFRENGVLASRPSNNSSEFEASAVSDLCKALEVLVIQTIHRVVVPIAEPLFRGVARAEIGPAIERFLTRNSGNQMDSSEPRSLELKFQNKLSVPVWTGTPIEGEGSQSIKIALVDTVKGEVVNSGPEASAKVEIVVLQGGINDGEGHEWTLEGSNQSLLSGAVHLNLKDGIGTMDKIKFKHTSTWRKNGELRLVARVVDDFTGTRVKEAMTETFILKDKRLKCREKHDIPSLSDPVWRLYNIDRRGAIRGRLEKHKITTVQKFLEEFNSDPKKLRDITNMTDKKFHETVAHASTCSKQTRVIAPVDNSNNLGIEDYELSEMFLTCPPSNVLKSPIGNPESMIPDFEMEQQQGPGNSFNIWAMDSGIGMESYFNQQSAKSNFIPVSQKRWLKMSIVLRFQQVMVLKANVRKRQRCS